MSQSTSWYRGDDVAQSLGENYNRYLVPTIFGPWAVDLFALAAPQPGERILDVACGTGAVAREAVRAIGAAGRVTGLDLNTECSTSPVRTTRKEPCSGKRARHRRCLSQMRVLPLCSASRGCNISPTERLPCGKCIGC